jgi:hypothetical protein
VWTGVEYQVAAHLIYEGEVEAGLRLVEATRSRYDGEKRNPWDELECGHHYARALSSWSLLLALSGIEYNAVEQRLRFAPRMQQTNFRTFFSTGSAWGTYAQRLHNPSGRQTHLLRILGGELTLAQFEVPLLRRPGRFHVEALGDRTFRAGDRLSVHVDNA